MSLTNEEWTVYNDLKQKERKGTLSPKAQKFLSDLESKKGGSSSRSSSKEYDPKDYTAKSGCETKIVSATKENGQKQAPKLAGKRVTWAWKVSKGFMYAFSCKPTKYSKEAKSKEGIVWISGIAISVTKRGKDGISYPVSNRAINKNGQEKGIWWGIMEKSTGKVISKELGLVFDPRTKGFDTKGRKGVVGSLGKKD